MLLKLLDSCTVILNRLKTRSNYGLRKINLFYGNIKTFLNKMNKILTI